MEIKKYLALLLAGTLMFSMAIVVSASESYGNESWSGNSTSDSSYEGYSEGNSTSEAGVFVATASAAQEAGKSVGEYNNNAVTGTPGLTSAIPVAQGGGVVIDGTKTNQSFTVSKAALNQVNSAKAQATALNGTVLNVVNISGSVSFNTANVNYYMPGITGTENIQVYQLAGGQWTPVTVTEVRADHVIVDMTSYGVLAFIQVP